MELSPCIFIFALIAASQAAEWGYSGEKGPSNWKTVNANCGGSKQSPIDIKEVEEDTTLEPVTPNNMYSTIPSGTWDMKNNGHSVGVEVGAGYEITKGSLGATYKLYGFHFHWGSSDSQGSEHTVDGKQYPLELHLVHYNSKYADVATAIDKADGLAVLGFFFKIGATNSNLQAIIDKFGELENAESGSTMTPINLYNLMGGSDSNFKDYYRYDGSLTTPSCDESVKWTVFKKVLEVSSEQMEKFRELKFTGGASMMDNFRPVMPLNGRKVKSIVGNSATTKSLSALLFVISFIVSIKMFS